MQIFYVRLPRWLITGHWQGSKVSALGSKFRNSVRSGQRALDITPASVRQKVPIRSLQVSVLCLAWQVLYSLDITRKGSNKPTTQCWLAFCSPESKWGTAACARRHRIIIRTLQLPPGCRGLDRGEGRARGTFSTGRCLTIRGRNAASCCNGKNKTFTLSLKPTGDRS